MSNKPVLYNNAPYAIINGAARACFVLKHKTYVLMQTSIKKWYTVQKLRKLGYNVEIHYN